MPNFGAAPPEKCFDFSRKICYNVFREIEERTSKSISAAKLRWAGRKGIAAEAQTLFRSKSLTLGARENTFATVTDVENY